MYIILFVLIFQRFQFECILRHFHVRLMLLAEIFELAGGSLAITDFFLAKYDKLLNVRVEKVKPSLIHFRFILSSGSWASKTSYCICNLTLK